MYPCPRSVAEVGSSSRRSGSHYAWRPTQLHHSALRQVDILANIANCEICAHAGDLKTLATWWQLTGLSRRRRVA